MSDPELLGSVVLRELRAAHQRVEEARIAVRNAHTRAIEASGVSLDALRSAYRMAGLCAECEAPTTECRCCLGCTHDVGGSP